MSLFTNSPQPRRFPKLNYRDNPHVRITTATDRRRPPVRTLNSAPLVLPAEDAAAPLVELAGALELDPVREALAPDDADPEFAAVEVAREKLWDVVLSPVTVTVDPPVNVAGAAVTA